MICSEALRPIETRLGRGTWADQVRENPRAQVRGAVLGRIHPRTVERPDYLETWAAETGGRRGQRVGGNDPGFGRTVPPKPARGSSGVVPAHAL